MTEKSYILHGPAGCGKSRNSHAIARALGLSRVVDGWDGSEDAYVFLNTLHVINDLPEWAKGNRRVLTFEQAMDICRNPPAHLKGLK